MSLQDDLERIQHPVPRFYVAAIIGALLVAGLILAERGMILAAMLTLFLGALGLTTRWRSVPVLLLVVLSLFLAARSQGHDLLSLLYRILIPWSRSRGYYGEYQPEPLLDAILVLVLLVYLQGQYRLTGLLTQALPSEGRLGSDRRRPILRELPPADTGEGLTGAGLLMVMLTLAVFTWVLVSMSRPIEGVAPEVWRMLLLAWLLATCLVGVSTVVRIAFFRRASPEVHRLFLQDVLWRETRGEQSRITRWVMAARMKAQKRKEKS